MQPRVSLIMPAYDRAGLIGESIRSALAQSYEAFELIVVDDGSTDATRDVVRSFTDPRVRLLEREHRGMSAAMNAGVRAARGVYYARLDSDDLLEPEFIEVLLEAIERPPAVGVAYARCTTFSDDPTRAQLERGHPLRYPDHPFESMLVQDHASAAALVRVECHARVGGMDESLPHWEDWDFWLRVARHYDFRFVDRPLARLRIHGGQVCTVADTEAWESRVRVLDKIFAGDEPLEPRASRLRPIAYRNVYFDIGLALWQRSQHRHAARAFGAGIRASQAPVRAAGRLLYLLALQQAVRVPALRQAHGMLSRVRQQTRQ